MGDISYDLRTLAAWFKGGSGVTPWQAYNAAVDILAIIGREAPQISGDPTSHTVTSAANHVVALADRASLPGFQARTIDWGKLLSAMPGILLQLVPILFGQSAAKIANA